MEDAFFGISQASIVHNDEQLAERVRFIHEKTNDRAIAEQYIEGREIYVGVIGNTRLKTFPAWEMNFGVFPLKLPELQPAESKWDRGYQKKHEITTHAAQDLDLAMQEKISKLCKRVYRALSLLVTPVWICV